MKILKRILSLVLTLIMIFTSIPMTFIKKFSITADATSYKVDDIIEFGMYPQSEVSDVSLITSLNSLAPSWIYWTSYGYYSGDGNIGSMVCGDWMRYTDVEYNGQKYRGVKFSQYRPYYTYKTSAVTYQDDNGYDTDITYWFKFEPLEWRLLDPVNGLVICETIIDSQPFSNTLYCIGDGIYDCFNNSEKVTYANDYKTSSIREWLNKDFYNTAFTNEEKLEIGKANINNDGYYTSVNVENFDKLDGDNLSDSIFLLSYNEVKKSEYQFETDSVKFDSTRTAMASDYAKIQGLYVYNDLDSAFNGNSFWSLRTPGNISYCSCYVTYQGCSRSFYGVDYVSGVRPAFCFGWGDCGGNLENPIGESESYKREHVVDNWKALNQSYKSEYLAGFAVPMDGTNGTPDYLVPGQSENMIPQGLTYWPEKDWVLVSSYDKSEKNPSSIFALDRESGTFVAQFNLYTKNGEAWKCHAGGIGVSNNNLYITSGKGVGYFPLSVLDVPSGTVKDIVREGHIDFGQLGKTYSAYVNISDGVLWTGNFHSVSAGADVLAGFGAIPDSWTWEANEDYYSAILGFKLSGNTSKKEWNNLISIKDDASYIINVDNDIDSIQGIAFKKLKDSTYNMYLSRTTDASFGASISVATVNLSKEVIEVKKSKFNFYQNLPGTEGITFINNDLHILYESGALGVSGGFFNQAIWNQHFKDSTDVIWKVNEEKLLHIPQLESSWFEKNAYGGYNHELARFCANYCVLGYCKNYTETEYYLNKSGFSMLSCDVGAERDEVNYFIAEKDVTVAGKTKRIIFVGCIGSHQDQWYSNFDPLGKYRKITDDRDSEKYLAHIGFVDAREYVYGKLEQYIKNDPNAIILLTGHSRGAATVNLLAAKLIDNASSVGINADNVYTYGFATPKTVNTIMGPMFKKYDSIFSIVNPEDLVTKMIPYDWGFSRYGITYTLPSSTNDKNYKSLKDKMNKEYTLLMNGESYHPYPGGEELTYTIVNRLTKKVDSIDQLYENKFNWSGDLVSIQKFITDTLCKYQASKSGSSEKEEAKDALLNTWLFPFSSHGLIHNLAEYFVLYQGIGATTDGWIMDDYFNEAHQAETYYAYMLSMTSDELTEDRDEYRGSVNCPVNVEIYDKDTDELVGRIVNNMVDEEVAAGENAVVMAVDGDSKSFWLPSNGDYEIKLIGNDDGTRDYTMSEIDSDIGEVKRVNFFDVEITDGLTMTADIEAEEFAIEEHELTFEDGETLEPTETFVEDDILVCNINISASKGGSTSSSQTAKSGDYVILDAIAEDGWKFIGWYENNEVISTDTTFAFVVKNDKNLEAKFEHVDHSFGDWCEVEPATCENVGTELRSCFDCKYTETRNIPFNGHNFGEWYISIPAKCEVVGIEQRDCLVCDYFEIKEIPGNEHSYESVVTPATCYSNGFTTNTCTKCGNVYTSDIAEMLTHNFCDWYEITPAMCEIDGLEQRECSECDYSETQNIPATGHSYDNGVCTSCGEDLKDTCSCNCHAGGIKGFFFKIGLFFQRIFKKNKVCKCGSNHY